MRDAEVVVNDRVDPDPDVLLLAADVAERLNVSTAGVRYLIRRGRLKVAAITPRGVKIFSRLEVERLRIDRAIKA